MNLGLTSHQPDDTRVYSSLLLTARSIYQERYFALTLRLRMVGNTLLLAQARTEMV
jgi:hypothetical protein